MSLLPSLVLNSLSVHLLASTGFTLCNPVSAEISDTDTVHNSLIHEDTVCRLKFPVPRSYSCDLSQSKQLLFNMESLADIVTENSEKATSSQLGGEECQQPRTQAPFRYPQSGYLNCEMDDRQL
ncbi:hypothetical protein EG68_03831 [Paragonimus skrjabini miyazakii]|uniref:Uncharacterized protein n=1 Tax=Paragonimus skrjabini miyazakii TaxID=59628 RepID=A0A8S9Z8Z9_9TREM|nr:hypothetical protein EG68_03831 [Paragonimus skrjabini miyazakii]